VSIRLTPKVDGFTENAAGFGGILGFAPNSLSRDAHCAKTQAVDRQVAADFEHAARRGVRF